MARVRTHLNLKDYLLILLLIIISTAFAVFFQLNQIITGDQLQMLDKGYLGAITGNFLPYGNAARLLIIISTAFAVFFQLNQIITGDQLQMLDKGYLGAITGNFLPYGNAASTVGNVPGSLSSYIVGYPLTWYMHPIAPVALLIGLRVLSIFIFVNAVAQILKPRTVVIATLLYALSPWFLYEELLYNPSYLAFGSAVFLNMLVRIRRKGRDVPYLTAFLASVMLSLSAGFCLQLHFSWPVLVAICGILYLRRDIRISFLGIFVGLAIVAASLIPYINEVMVNEAIRENNDQIAQERYLGYGLVHVYPVLKAVLYWFRFGSLLVTKKALVPDVAADAPVYLEILRYVYLVITQAIGGLTVLIAVYANYKVLSSSPFAHHEGTDAPVYLEILRYVYLVITQAIGGLTVLIAVYANYKVLSSSPFAHHEGTSFIRSLTIASILAVMMAGAASTITFSYWHLILIFAFAMLPILVLFEHSHRIRNVHIVYLAVAMIVMNLISAINSDKFNIHASYTDQVNYLCLQKYEAAQCGLSEAAAKELSLRHEFNLCYKFR